MKRLLSLLLALCLLATLAVGVSAAEDSYAGKTVLICTGNLRGNLELYPAIKAARDAYAAKGANVILADTGNFMQGDGRVNDTFGEAAYTLMDAVGYQVAGMGLAEFGYADATTGYAYHGNFTRYYTQAMLQNGTGELTYNRNRDGSVTGTLPARAPAKFTAVCAGLTPLQENVYAFEPSYDCALPGGKVLRFVDGDDNAFTDRVQDGFLARADVSVSKDGADLTVLLCDSPLSEPVGPTAPTAPTGAGADTLVVAPEKDGQLLTGVYVIDNDTLAVTHEPLDLTGRDETIGALVETYVPARVLGTAEMILDGRDSVNRARETDYGDLVTDALVWYAKNYVDGFDKSLPLVGIVNGGNLDNFIYTGDVTETVLLRALPFSPMGIGVITVTGQQLLETLEAATQTLPCPGFAQVSGLEYRIYAPEEYDAGEAYGKFFRADSIRRVEILSVNGQPFDPQASYNLVADNYLINGNDTYYTLAEAKKAGAPWVNNGNGKKVRDIFADYLQQVLGGNLDPCDCEPNRIEIVNRHRLPCLDESTCPGLTAFTDMPDRGTWAHNPIDWAVENGVTNGMTATTFVPQGTITRGQAVTFLWRAAGKPAPEKSETEFTDLKQGAFYYDAVLWAVEKGITNGMTATTFNPDGPCTRGQIVTFLYRFAEKPAVPTGPSPFTDLAENAYYSAPVAWAVACGVTNGMSPTTFAPDATCNRAQVVTFLYRQQDS